MILYGNTNAQVLSEIQTRNKTQEQTNNEKLLKFLLALLFYSLVTFAFIKVSIPNLDIKIVLPINLFSKFLSTISNKYYQAPAFIRKILNMLICTLIFSVAAYILNSNSIFIIKYALSALFGFILHQILFNSSLAISKFFYTKAGDINFFMIILLFFVFALTYYILNKITTIIVISVCIAIITYLLIMSFIIQDHNWIEIIGLSIFNAYLVYKLIQELGFFVRTNN